MTLGNESVNNQQDGVRDIGLNEIEEDEEEPKSNIHKDDCDINIELASR